MRKIYPFASIILYSVTSINLLHFVLAKDTISSIGCSLVLLAMILINSFQKNVSMLIPIKTFLNLFLVLSFIYGLFIDMYSFLWWWDVSMHLFSGILLFFIGLLISFYLLSKISEKFYLLFVLSFSFLFVLSCTLVWELIEFFCDYFLLTTFQNASTGLLDTMTDIIADTSSATLTMLILLFYQSKNNLLKKWFNKIYYLQYD